MIRLAESPEATARLAGSPAPERRQARDIAWGAVWAGYGIALLGTLAAGGLGLSALGEGMWWVAGWGTVFLLVGGFVAGAVARTAEPLNGAFIAVFYFGTTVTVVFVGEFLAVLPDPLPGLPHGDSTFYFVWPLGQAVAATAGATLGGWLFTRRRR